MECYHKIQLRDELAVGGCSCGPREVADFTGARKARKTDRVASLAMKILLNSVPECRPTIQMFLVYTGSLKTWSIDPRF